MTTSSPAWGILGTGGIAAAMTRDLQLDGHTVAAVGSRTPEAAARFAAAHAIPRSHGSYEELVADPGVDVVYIATPHPQHAPNALLALAAGKHVLVEKPFTMDQREAQQIARLRSLAQNAKLDPDFAEKFLNFIVSEVIRHHEAIARK